MLVSPEKPDEIAAKVIVPATATQLRAPRILVQEVGATYLAHFSWLTSMTVNRISTATAPM